MNAPRCSPRDPRQAAEVLDLLSRLENTKLLAGGQSLMPMLNMRYMLPDHLIDLRRVEGLSSLEESWAGLDVDAVVRQRDMEFSDVAQSRPPVVPEALQWVGHRQTRNRGTLGGSLCHLDPAAELVIVAAVLDAILTAKGSGDQRVIAFKDFPVGFMAPCLSPQEILTGVHFPFWPEQHDWGFAVYARRRGDCAIVSAAALVLRDAVGRIERAAIARGEMAPTPVRVSWAEALYQDSLIRTRAPNHACRHDRPRLILQSVPSVAAVLHEVVTILEHAVRKPVIAHELPDVLLGIEFGALRRQRDDRDIVRHGELGGKVPAGLVEQQRNMAAGCDVGRDRSKMQVHHRRVAPRQDQADGLALLGADGAEGRLPRLAQRRVILFFWPTRASSPNQTSMSLGLRPWWCAIVSNTAGNFF
jgi:aerobic carbon-monoxide dehydrogenase medium subunit